MTPPTTVVTVSRFDVALPFFVSAALSLISLPLGNFIGGRLKEIVTGWANETNEAARLSIALDPASIAVTTAWTVDAAQIVAMILAPVVGVLILRPHLSKDIVAVYVISFLLSAAAFFFFIQKVRPDTYWRRRWFRLFSPVSFIGLVLELAAAVIAGWVIGP